MYLTLSKHDISPIIDRHTGDNIFMNGLVRAGQSNIALIELLAQYVQFNSVFGAGVANLAGEIARRQDIFRDLGEPIALIADRSCDVASSIFFAAIDEFGRKKTHRAMAQDTFKESVRFLQITKNEIEELSSPDAETSTAIRSVTDGYCLNRAVTDAELFFGIGFHIGSELLADQEFNILDRYLKHEQPALVAHLQREKAYSWVAVHTTVEADHFDAALDSANLALRFYTGNQTEAHGWLLHGFKHFAEIQTRFMHSLFVASSTRLESFDDCASA